MGASPTDELTGDRSEPVDLEFRHTVREIVLRSIATLDPSELAVVEDVIDPLVDRASRGERIDHDSGLGPGAFGAAELVVWAVVPIALQAVMNLVARFGGNWVDELRTRRSQGLLGDEYELALTTAEAKVLVRVPASHAHAVPDLVRAVHEAILSHVGAAPAALPGGGRATRRTSFRDFAITIDPDGAGRLRSRVLPSSGGGSSAPFRLPFSLAEIPSVVARLEPYVRGTARNVEPLEGTQPVRDATTLGGELFEALFTGGVRDAYERALSATRSRGEGLRIRMVMAPEQRALCALPWELLFDHRERHFLCHDPDTPVVRYLQLPAPADPRLDPARRPLRVLVATAVPYDAAALASLYETRLIDEALGGNEDIVPETLRNVTAASLRRSVRDVSPHVLHFIGHGAFPDASRPGTVVLTGPGGESDAVTGGELSTMLLGCDDLRLVVLNACDTGSLPRRDGLDPFAGVAAALLQGGIPAVVAMQFPIGDEAAVRFAGSIYTILADGEPIEAAVAEGRQAIFNHDRQRGSHEWATPVLFLQAQDGDLLRFQVED